ncbi:right-handed parallel beta-helix repeat-containing protein [Isoptericola aurantiacus]|uniref:right-handed parallel beta-helix repeat-containing protein n=1 Tax=Isoptericola aurantiacus TaxID=3377839 RepID=UPI003839FA0A
MTPTGKRIRTSLAALAAAALTVTGATAAVAVGPETALNANDLAPGDYTAVTDTGTDFTIYADESKKVTVDDTDRISDRGDVFTQRIKLNGSGDADRRSLHFSVGADQVPTEVVVNARSSSGSSDRALALYDATGEIARVDALADDEGTPVVTSTLDIDTAGDYYLASPSSGVNVFSAQLGAVDDAGRGPWADVAAPTVDSVVVDADDPAQLDVSYTGLLGPDGGDVVAATLYDAAGAVADRTLGAADGASGTLSLTPPASGDYEVEVQITRYGEADALVSERVSTGSFSLPLVGPEVTGALTSAVAGGQATVTLEWSATPEAETYAVETGQGGTFTTALDGVTGTTADVTGLTPGETYQVRVVAHRGSDSATGPVADVDVATSVERWQIADLGANANSGGAVTDNGDGTITFDAKESSTKFATSEDGFQYYYTAIDPETENFTLTATFHVDDASTKDNQSGFGVIAVDDLVAGSGSDRYFNSAGALITRYGEGTDSVQDGAPGARFVQGYTGATDDNTAGSRDSSDSELFDPEYRSEITSGPKFAEGDVYELTLRKSNTGFHAIWRDAPGGEPIEVIQYDPDMLLQQNSEVFYVGMAAARKIVVTVTDWDFTTIAPEDDEEAQEPPTEYVPTNLSVDVTSTTPERQLDIPLVADFYGTGQILDAAGDVVVDGLELAPGEQALGTVDLEPGENRFTARATPEGDQPQLGEYEELESFDPVDVPVTVTVDSYGEPGESLWVAPDGSPDGAGTQADPLDLHTAVGYAQAGQQIVLADGTYTPQRRIVAERGRDGTADAPITLMSEPGSRAVLDLSESDGGLVLRGDWWHVYDLEITGSGDKEKPMLIQGNHNVVERVESHHNLDTGFQISGSQNEPPSMWPSDNTILSSVSHHNADPGGNDADGFGVKLTVGEGNVLRYNIAHHNIDDGWDLYAKSTTGPIGTVVIEDSVAYDNGFLDDGSGRTGEGNGFKLGGESMPGDHLLRNAVSFGNLGTGATSNSGPDVRLDGVTSVGNDRGVRLETNASSTAYEASGVISWQNPAEDVLGLKQDDTSLLTDPSNYFDGTTADASDGRPASVGADWFVSTDTSTTMPEIAADGSIDMHGLYELTDVAPSDTGARLTANPDPTVIELLPEVQAPLENTVAPSISGDAVKGSRLSADPGEWSAEAEYSYRWLRDGEPIEKKGGSASYKVKRADVGHELSVEVTAVADGGEPVVAVSDPVTVQDKGHHHGGWVRDLVDHVLDWLARLFGGR